MRIGSGFDQKIKKGWLGRKESTQRVTSRIAPTDRVIWMHAASLGEYEQGLPVLEKLKEKYPTHKILVSFFSPSGYENVVKKATIADVVCYLPFDQKKTLRDFVSHFKTEIFFTVKYDYWYHLLQILKEQNARIFVVSALFYPRQVFFKPYGKWFVRELRQNIDWIFHQNKTSEQLAQSIGLRQSSTSGDTRFDRVKQILHRDNAVAWIPEFTQGRTTLVFGSSWQAEERIAKLVADKHPEARLIIVPHDLKRVENLKTLFPNAVCYSKIMADGGWQGFSEMPSVLIVDCIGLLSKLYSYGEIAVVGGGFHSAGLHNILEAATFGMPVIFGNHYRKNPEADALVASQGGATFSDENTVAIFISKLIETPAERQEMARRAGAFIAEQPNATEHILQQIFLD